MDQTSRLAALIQQSIDECIQRQRALLADLGSDVTPLINIAEQFLSGGKRMRGQFAILAYDAVSPSFDPLATEPPKQVLLAAAALEFFHAAALVHDDLIDKSDLRRGRPAVHKAFEAVHQEQRWQGSAEHYGISTAILVGDMLQSWADELFDQAVRLVKPDSAQAARAHFNTMRTEVAAGQYLDLLEEQLSGFGTEEEQLERATRVLVYKSAKYSVEAPLLIGAALAGASPDAELAFSDFGLPVGVAFQLRDDLLGVFGDTELTGKPAGDDLREGKRTVLVGLTRQQLPANAKRLFDELLGDPTLDAEQILMLQRTIRDAGAVESVEKMIANNVERAVEALAGSHLSERAKSSLGALADKAANRVA